ncbi:MAG: hypothetical protein IKX26_07410 [Bacteroidales bacterium]|nr:hypothetical protein [Bacteroidales bacterium]
MKEKLFYEQPQAKVLLIRTEGLMQMASRKGGGYGGQQVVPDWDSSDDDA